MAGSRHKQADAIAGNAKTSRGSKVPENVKINFKNEKWPGRKELENKVDSTLERDSHIV